MTMNVAFWLERDDFYKYLCIRTHFRGEMIQINKRVGFTNFQQYQRRKQYFIQGEKPYEKELVRLALNESLNKDNIVSLEARICPGKTSLEMEKEFYNFNSIVEEVEDEEKQKKWLYRKFDFLTEKIVLCITFPKDKR